MLIFRVMGLFALIPATLLLAVSFFVLLSLRKVEQEGFRLFGYSIAVLLWLGAALIFSAGAYTVSTGRHPMLGMMQEMAKCKMQGMMSMPGLMKAERQKMMPRDKAQDKDPGQMDESMMKR